MIAFHITGTATDASNPDALTPLAGYGVRAVSPTKGLTTTDAQGRYDLTISTEEAAYQSWVDGGTVFVLALEDVNGREIMRKEVGLPLMETAIAEGVSLDFHYQEPTTETGEELIISDFSSLNFYTELRAEEQQIVKFTHRVAPNDPLRVQFALTKNAPLLSVTITDLTSGLVQVLSPVQVGKTDTHAFYNVDFSRTQPGCYRMEFREMDIVLASSDFMVTEDIAGTALVGYTNYKNEGNTIFNPGSPFYIRLEARLFPQNITFGVETNDFRDQHYRLRQLSASPVNTYKFVFGGRYGAPNWYGNAINRIFSCSTVTIDGETFTRSDGARVERVQVSPSEMYPLYRFSLDCEKAQDGAKRVKVSRVVRTFDLTYHFGTEDDPKDLIFAYEEGVSVTLGTPESLGHALRYYKFKGWTDSDGNTVTEVVMTQDMTVTAVLTGPYYNLLKGSRSLENLQRFTSTTAAWPNKRGSFFWRTWTTQPTAEAPDGFTSITTPLPKNQGYGNNDLGVVAYASTPQVEGRTYVLSFFARKYIEDEKQLTCTAFSAIMDSDKQILYVNGVPTTPENLLLAAGETGIVWVEFVQAIVPTVPTAGLTDFGVSNAFTINKDNRTSAGLEAWGFQLEDVTDLPADRQRAHRWTPHIEDDEAV